MKVVYITEFIDIAGGIERGLTTRANYLVEKCNYEVVIFCTNKATGIPYYKLNPKVEVMFLEQLSTSMSFLGRLKLQYRQSQEIINQNSNVIISVKFTLHNFFLQLLKTNQKLISELRESKALYYKNNVTFKAKIFNRFRKFVFSKQDLIITLTKEDKIQWGLKNMEFVHNSKMIETSTTSSLDNERVVSISRLDSIKGLNYLIEAWYIVNKEYPNWTLKICGEGNEYTNLKNQISELGLDDVIILNNESVNVVPEYLESSIFVLTSKYEAFGNVLVEAQTFGLPVVSFDSPYGPKEIINDEIDGFLVPLFNVEELASRISLLIKDKDLRKTMGLQAIENSKRFELHNIMQKYISLIS